MSEQSTIAVSIRKWSPQGDGPFVRYSIPVDGEMDVLNVLEYVRAHLDPSVSYRSSCRRGVCGGCRVTIDGNLRLACETEVRDGMKIDPYRTGRNPDA